MKRFLLGIAAFAAMIGLAHANVPHKYSIQDVISPPAEDGTFAIHIDVHAMTGQIITMVWNVRTFPDAESCAAFLAVQLAPDAAPDSKDPIFARDMVVLELLAERNHAVIEEPPACAPRKGPDSSI